MEQDQAHFVMGAAMGYRLIALTLTVLLGYSASSPAQSRDQKVRQDKRKIEAEGLWIYNDFPKAQAQAKSTGKPIMAVLRCLPCEECVKLDDEVIRQEPTIQKHLNSFVRLRLVSTNGLDLSIFQFDTDQSFAIFFLEADGSILGRFGTRSHSTDWRGDVSVEGLAKAMTLALKIHASYPANKADLAGKTGPKPAYPTPEKLPTLSGKFTNSLDYDGNVVKSCIHCHQIGDALREIALVKKAPFDDSLLFPYPHPKAIGFSLDPNNSTSVLAVAPNSPASNAGFKPGDCITEMQGQPLISIADMQWILQNTQPAETTLHGKRIRLGNLEDFSLKLPSGWRHQDDISWRASTWGLRRAALGGIFFKPASSDQKNNLVVEHVGAYAPHDLAKRAGFQKGDILLSWDHVKDFKRETDIIAHMLQMRAESHKPVPVTILRDGKEMELKLTLNP